MFSSMVLILPFVNNTHFHVNRTESNKQLEPRSKFSDSSGKIEVGLAAAARQRSPVLSNVIEV